MKKYLIPTSILLATSAIVSAQDVAGTVSVDSAPVKVQVRTMAAPTGAAAVRTNQAASVTLTPVSGTMPAVAAGSAVMVQGMPGRPMGVMTTGDQAVDAKIRALEEERMTKIKAINVEYDAKVKAAIGNLKVQAYTTSAAAVSGEAGAMPVGAAADAQGTMQVQTMEGHPMPMQAQANMAAQVEVAPTGIKGFFWKLFH